MSVDSLYETMGLHRIVEMDPEGRARLEYLAKPGMCHSGGVVQGGFTVRSYFNPFKGKRGVRSIVVAHDDAEKVTGGLAGVSVVGGLIKNAYV